MAKETRHLPLQPRNKSSYENKEERLRIRSNEVGELTMDKCALLDCELEGDEPTLQEYSDVWLCSVR